MASKGYVRDLAVYELRRKTHQTQRGRAVWQIEDAGLLLLAYEACENAGVREKQLLAEYKAKNGNYPLANWRG